MGRKETKKPRARKLRMSTGLCLSGKMCDGYSPAKATTGIILSLWSYRWVHCHCRISDLPRMGDKMEKRRDLFFNSCEEGLNPRLEPRSPTLKAF